MQELKSIMTQTDRQNDRQTFEFLGLLSEPKNNKCDDISQLLNSVFMFIYKTAFDLNEPEHDLMRLLLHSQANRPVLGESKCE